MTVGEYQVVVNDEEQYSIWPAGREQAPGWRAAGFAGSRDDCLAHIRVLWTDLRPRSVREHLG
ncbi:MAG: MbtH family protein [Labedaea sp.]